MSWEDRDYSGSDDSGGGFGRPGGDWQGVRPTFDNFFSWSVFLGRISRIDIRVHIFFLLFIIIELLKSVWKYASTEDSASISVGLTAVWVASLFVIVLAHEFGHCLACRWSRGEANEILMWPLGGLAFCRPRNHWVSHLVTAIGGPMVNVVLCVLVGTMLGLLTGKWLGVALPNPIQPFAGMQDPKVMQSMAHQTLYLINVMSLVLLLFNLLPIFPLDGGRIVQALLWPRVGFANSMRIAVRSGYIGAVLLFIFGMVQGNMMIVMIAGFGGITCYITHKQLRFTEDFMGFEDDQFMIERLDKAAESQPEAAPNKRDQKRSERDQKRQEEEATELDRILQKIADSGMESLTARERKLLQNVTHRKRKNE